MLISRRGFLKLIGAAIAAGAAVPAFTKSRAPYVVAGEGGGLHRPPPRRIHWRSDCTSRLARGTGSAIRYFCGTTPTARAVIWSATTTLTSRTSLVMCRATFGTTRATARSTRTVHMVS